MLNNDLPLAGRVRSAFSARHGAQWVAGIVNAVLIVLYVWSHGGGTVQLRIETDGANYRAYVDGKEVASPSFPGHDPDLLAIGVPEEDIVPSLPGPTGIDSVRVTDRSSGEVIFEEDFGDWQPDVWTLDTGEERVGDGVFSTGPEFASISTDIDAWDHHSIEIEFRNVPQASATLREGRNALSFRIVPFDAYQSRVDRVEEGAPTSMFGGADLELDRTETVKSMVAMLLRPYPYLLGLLAATALFAFAVRVPALDERLRALGSLLAPRAAIAVVALAVVAAGWLSYLIYALGDAMPHVPDSAAYVFQAKIFASFHITTDVPAVVRSFTFTDPSPMQAVDGRWFSQYPFGHPLFLAVGELFGVIWLVPPFLGAASVFLIYRLGHYVYGPAVGLLAAILLFFSPFFQMMASNLMSHNTAVFVILMCLFLYARPTKRRVLSMLASGVFLGLAFNIRPLTAVTLMPILGGLFAIDILRSADDRRTLFRAYGAFAAGSVLMLLAYFLYNQLTTGDPFTSGYALTNTYSDDSFGFSGTHTLARGLQNENQLLAFMLLVANGWPAVIGLSLAAIPFILGTRHRWDYFLAAAAIALCVSTILYRNAALMYGPRFWYEAMPFLLLLTARGVQRLWETSLVAANELTARTRWPARPPSGGLVAAVLVCLVAGLIAFSAYGWMFGARDAWEGHPAVPQKASLLEGFNSTDDRLLRVADDMDIENALVLVNDCEHWWCYGSVFWANTTGLDGNIVWAERSTTEQDTLLIEAYADRALFVADYDAGTIRPATAEEILNSNADQETAD